MGNLFLQKWSFVSETWNNDRSLFTGQAWANNGRIQFRTGNRGFSASLQENLSKDFAVSQSRCSFQKELLKTRTRYAQLFRHS